MAPLNNIRRLALSTLQMSDSLYNAGPATLCPHYKLPQYCLLNGNENRAMTAALIGHLRYLLRSLQ